MNVGSLFSGIGGIELGFAAAGFRTEWFVEIDPYAQAILKKHFPNAKIYGDITKIDFRTIPKVDILTGGFPCQDISNAGKRIGITGSRSSLWKHYLRAISTIRPRYALIENVSAILGRGLNVVLCDLASVRYDAEWHCIPASSVGALHKRDRVFIIAYPDNRCRQDDQISTRWHPIEKGINQLGNVSDTEITGLEGEQYKTRCTSRCSEWSEQDYWSAEPDVGRVAHGVSFRVDRIKCLGNAVVPQLAEIFAQAIKEHEKGG